MSGCKKCGFWDSDYEACSCPHSDKWYACPIESERPENKKVLQEYAEWVSNYHNQFVMKEDT